MTDAPTRRRYPPADPPEARIERHIRATAADPALDAHRRHREAKAVESAGRVLRREFTSREGVSLREVLSRLDEIAEAHRQGVSA